MLNRNHVEIIGFVGKVEVKSNNGKKHALIDIATSERWVKNDERKERTDWHQFKVFMPALVDLVEKHVRKGQYLSIIGKLRSGQFEKNGETIYTYEPHAVEIGFLEPAPEGAERYEGEA
jgi:single-strand DNA-binding protein